LSAPTVLQRAFVQDQSIKQRCGALRFRSSLHEGLFMSETSERILTHTDWSRLRAESVPLTPSPERPGPEQSPHDLPDPGPQALAWLRALRVVSPAASDLRPH
jgi:hypothetical protein